MMYYLKWKDMVKGPYDLNEIEYRVLQTLGGTASQKPQNESAKSASSKNYSNVPESCQSSEG